MALRILNSLTQEKETFIPLKPGEVSMYACGPTVYDDPHIGHLRSAYIFEVMRRYLQYSGFKVRFVRNVTDVDDKIIDKAREEKPADLIEAVRRVSDTYLARYKRDLKRMGISDATVEPKATEHLGEMISLIGRLFEKEAAYASAGDVYFDVHRFKEYGRLSKQNQKAMLENVRVDKNEKKRDPLDFALWKQAKEGEPGWESPWGRGRPGWHIECSAMSMKYLGETFDIHGGGRDLIFPHHENEIAQSEAATGVPFAKHWVHHGLITVQGQKMSKSLKNFFTLEDVLREEPRFGEEILKLTFLGTHYSAPLDYSSERRAMDRAVWRRFYEFFQNARQAERDGHRAAEKTTPTLYAPLKEAMDNDFNTPDALSHMHALIADAYRKQDAVFTVTAASVIRNFGAEVFGIEFDQDEQSHDAKAQIEEAIRQRSAARSSKDFRLADEIRAKLLNDRRVELRDLPDGRTTWRVRV